MFSKFSQGVNKNTTGCGLGLTICKQIVEKLGGSITLTSTTGIGTNVMVIIPTEITVQEHLITEDYFIEDEVLSLSKFPS